jgi:hypothetical protein
MYTVYSTPWFSSGAGFVRRGCGHTCRRASRAISRPCRRPLGRRLRASACALGKRRVHCYRSPHAHLLGLLPIMGPPSSPRCTLALRITVTSQHFLASQPGFRCPYLDTINRMILDFDFEKACSVTGHNFNVYACLVCGKYFQGRGKHTQAYTHALQESHHVYMNLQDGRTYCLPDGYEVVDSSLRDIQSMLNPEFTEAMISTLDTVPVYAPTPMHGMLVGRPRPEGDIGKEFVGRATVGRRRWDGGG